LKNIRIESRLNAIERSKLILADEVKIEIFLFLTNIFFRSVIWFQIIKFSKASFPF